MRHPPTARSAARNERLDLRVRLRAIGCAWHLVILLELLALAIWWRFYHSLLPRQNGIDSGHGHCGSRPEAMKRL